MENNKTKIANINTNVKNNSKNRKHKSGFALFWKRLFRRDTRSFKMNKKFYLTSIIVLSALFVFSIAFIIVDRTTNLINYTPSPSEQAGWPTKLLAPFADMTSWVPTSSEYSDNGVPNLEKVSDETGLLYYHFGFIQPSTTKPLDSEGNIRWCWGGYDSISENGADAYQYSGIINQMQKVRDLGGDFCISFGGQYGKAPWIVSQDENKLYQMYLDVIKTYNCKRIDLDIEESNQGENENIVNARAIKRVQDETGVAVSLTIPIMPYGWEQKQINILKAYLNSGVDISLINSMTMCYGAGLLSGEDYGDASVRAITNAVEQMQTIYSNLGINLTPAQAYAKTGATMAIGYESSLYPTFTVAMAKKVANDAIKNNYGMISYWSINRDAKMESNQAITNIYTYFDALKGYAES
ncbi:MAG: chitinase [Clostridia bacterium]|nr:chitinase [Clostridia bacterium]